MAGIAITRLKEIAADEYLNHVVLFCAANTLDTSYKQIPESPAANAVCSNPSWLKRDPK